MPRIVLSVVRSKCGDLRRFTGEKKIFTFLEGGPSNRSRINGIDKTNSNLVTGGCSHGPPHHSFGTAFPSLLPSAIRFRSDRVDYGNSEGQFGRGRPASKNQ